MGDFGSVKIVGSVGDIFDSVVYDVNANLSRFNVARLGFNDTLDTDLNLSLAAKGRGYTKETARGYANLFISPSRILDLTIDSAFVSTEYGGDRLNIDSASLSTTALSAYVSGSVSANGPSDVEYELLLQDASLLKRFVEADILEAKGSIKGQLSGMPDSIAAQAAIDLTGVSYDEVTVGSLRGELQGQYIDSALSASGWFKAEQIAQAELTLDSVHIDGEYGEEQATVNLDAYGQNGFESKLHSKIDLDSVTVLTLLDMSIRYGDLFWRGGSDSMTVLIDSSDYTVRNVNLQSQSADSAGKQTLEIRGKVSLTGESDFLASVDNLSLAPLASIFDLNLSGTLSSVWHLTGQLDNPTLDGDLVIAPGRYENFDFEQLAGKLEYLNQRANFTLNLRPAPAESLTIIGSAPVVLDTSRRHEVDSLIDIRVRADSLSLDVLKAAGYVVREAGGYIVCDLAIANTVANPYVNGRVQIRKGGLSIPEYGIDYTDMEAGITFEPNRVTVDSLAMAQDKGKFRMSGYMGFDGGLVRGKMTTSRLDLMTKDFYAVRHKHYEIQLTSDARLDAGDTESRYSGTVAVNRSSFWLPALIKEYSQTPADAARKPMLVAVTRPDTARVADSFGPTQPDKAVADSVQSEFMKNLRGSLKVTIPKNMWIRSPDLKLELAGDLDVVKEGADFELFGDVRVVTGPVQPLREEIQCQTRTDDIPGRCRLYRHFGHRRGVRVPHCCPREENAASLCHRNLGNARREILSR